MQVAERSSADALADLHAPAGSERYEELDSLRGLAALTVFVYHCIFLLAVRPHWIGLAVSSPVGLFFFGGHQAVILFFMLSGFVLYLPYTRRGKRSSYWAFMTKRTCRIYLPYLGALVFFVAAYLVFFRPHEMAGFLSQYGWRVLSTRELFKVVRDHILFLGLAKREYLNGATWTLVEEMRISFVFPFLALMVQKRGALKSLAAALTCSVLVSFGIHLVHHRSPLETFHYAGIFVLGAVLASSRVALVSAWNRLGGLVGSIAAALCVMGCGYAPALMERYPRIVTEEAGDWIIALTASVFLIAALGGGLFSAFLRHRAMQHFGRTSFGIYLLHLPLMFIAANLLWNRAPHYAVFASAFVATIGLAYLFYHFVERPSMALGKRLARRIEFSRERKDNACAAAVLVAGD